jgi:FtsP/CotA-like multicopper oxidase with cupredoxin domain
MRLSSAARLAASLPLACALLAPLACEEAPHGHPAVDDALPRIEGLIPAEDLDPSPHAVRYELVAHASDVKLVDKPIRAFTYNGQVPGPLLQARVGDDVTVVFTNQLNEPTTIHWHGLRIPNDMDGVVEGDMKAIEPGETFTYRFIVPDAGTFWFHPHVRTHVQIERGLYGMFVVHENDADAPDVDADRAFVLDDVLLDASGDIARFATSGMEIMHGRSGNVLLTNGTDSLKEVRFAPGQVERWRLVNTANARTMTLRFRGLQVKQIGADGGLWPQSLVERTQAVILPVGARAELEVRLADGATEAHMVSAVLALDGNNQVIELELPLVRVDLDESLPASTRRGHRADPAFTYLDDGPVTHSIAISGVNNNGVVQFTMNGVSWPEHEEWVVPHGSLQIIEIVNRLGMEHPFHLHGHFFQVLSRSGSRVGDDGLRDTTLVRGQERVRIAVLLDNPGMWMYHCHILEHEENGMMGMVMVEDGPGPSGQPSGGH